ncbi:dTDP-4-dehydrorhamnose 3,5-epimerase [Phenylobacterium montanum]|uniref:dTDP-4-dehydrorhamnose 3,5-epimerase n=2 Tax=Phenylobacterium montanum TaxID=2823693 RepID=A0A975G1B2_9CAUL|nr:dTDP-4-dehydrorhamnose 3,5-epimerase [Caulobacter sp. S6]
MTRIERLDMDGLALVTPSRYGDERGYFFEAFRAEHFEALEPGLAFVQDNQAFSAQQGVVRGLHFQIGPAAQGKLVRCLRGSILDVAVDIRRGSPSFGQHVAVTLSAENGRQLWVPPGFAHGYATQEPDCEVFYKVTAYYDRERERGLAWDDPDLNIDWGLAGAQAILSTKDQAQPRLAQSPAYFDYRASALAVGLAGDPEGI